MDLSLSNKTAIVTGSTRGIGRAIALELLRAGAEVYINGRTNETVDSFIKELQKSAFKARGFAADATKENDVQRLVQAAIKGSGRIDILVNNVGGAGVDYLEDISAAEWDEVIALNLKSTFLVSKEVIPFMKKQKSGKIINISSTTGLRGKVGGAHYAAAKGGIIGFTKALALELAPYNIHVNAVAPGFTDTDSTRRAYFDGKIYPGNMAEVVAKGTPMGRIVKPEDIARAVLFFSSDMSDFITGQVLVVDGGRTT